MITGDHWILIGCNTFLRAIRASSRDVAAIKKVIKIFSLACKGSVSNLMIVLKYMSRQAPSYSYRWFIFTQLMQVLTVVEVAEHHRDNLLTIIELY